MREGARFCPACGKSPEASPPTPSQPVVEDAAQEVPGTVEALACEATFTETARPIAPNSEETPAPEAPVIAPGAHAADGSQPAPQPATAPAPGTPPQNRKPVALALAATVAIAMVGGGLWVYKGRSSPAEATPAISSQPSTQPAAAASSSPVAEKPPAADPKPITIAEDKTPTPPEPQKIEKKAAPKKPAKKETPPVHNEAPVVAPPAPAPPRGSLEALRRELLECEKRSFFARPLCRERAQDRHCPDSHFSTTPECQRSGDASQNRGG